MKKISNYIILYIITLLLINNAYSQTANKSSYIYSQLPGIKSKDFFTLKELYKIDLDIFDQYSIYNFYGMDADGNDYLYIIDYHECTITVFDNNGKYINTLGGKGQGPSELLNPVSISIYNNTINIYEGFRGIKILNLKGIYIDYFIIPESNYNKIICYNNSYITVKKDVKQINSDVKKETYNLLTFSYDKKQDKYTNEKIITKYVLEKEYKRYYYPYWPEHIFSINSKFNIYFPKNINEYKINTFNTEGILLFTFGRKYENTPYSKSIINYFDKLQEKRPIGQKLKLPKYPPIVRYIMIDNNDYIWVLTGECSTDMGLDFRISSNCDIFDSNGTWLFSFKTPFIAHRSFIKNNRLYSTPTKDDNSIHVFEIIYKR